MDQIKLNIWYNAEFIKDEYVEYPVGYYYSDEADGLNGPFDTLEIAENALKEYSKILFDPMR